MSKRHLTYDPRQREHHVCVCTSCAVVVSNGDTSHVSSSTEQRIEANLELTGWLSRLGTADLGGYYNCELCTQVDIGVTHVYLTAAAFKAA